MPSAVLSYRVLVWVRGECKSPPPPPPCRRLFVGQFPRTMTEEELRGVLGAYGTIDECHLFRDGVTKEGKGVNTQLGWCLVW